ncbi:DUF2254 domain-containing protein [Stutzerimonas urumqiensis]|uniref:DUF2254 domain-containing protein n=1 Tax=Stutzerimonas urumqiensis TaxID=638269 RepID=UPI000EB074CF|nr:DUF2254 domain-containing protein [Stutzerimonas urumqiensis]
MSTLTNRLFRLYRRATDSIALYPTLVALGLVALCVVSIVLEMTWLQPYKQDLELGIVKNAANARLILGTLVGGVISLMVFSFSMVMVVLSTAANALSPRVLPGLISRRSHQVVLGFYLGTIIDSLLLVATIQEGDQINVPSLGIYLALVLGVVCLCLFIYFIRTISLSIQVDFNLNRLYKQTLAQLAEQRARWEALDTRPGWPDDTDWTVARSRKAGYFKALNQAAALDILARNDLRMSVQIHNGFFVMPGHPLFRLDRDPQDERLMDALLDCFDFYVEEYADRHHFFGFKQISEIAIRALSPAVNDPGTAIKAIDMLTVLFAERLRLPDHDVACDESGRPRLFLREMTLDAMLHAVLEPIRRYGHADVPVLLSLLQACKNLLFTGPDADAEAVLLRHAKAVIPRDGQVVEAIDLDVIDQAIERLNATLRHHGPIAPAPRGGILGADRCPTSQS